MNIKDQSAMQNKVAKRNTYERAQEILRQTLADLNKKRDEDPEHITGCDRICDLIVELIRIDYEHNLLVLQIEGKMA